MTDTEKPPDYGAILKQQIDDAIADIHNNPANKRILKQIGVKERLEKLFMCRARMYAHYELEDERIVKLCLSCIEDEKGYPRDDPVQLPEITIYTLVELGYKMKGFEDVYEGKRTLEEVIVDPYDKRVTGRGERPADAAAA
jgi:hypothetical protein